MLPRLRLDDLVQAALARVLPLCTVVLNQYLVLVCRGEQVQALNGLSGGFDKLLQQSLQAR